MQFNLTCQNIFICVHRSQFAYPADTCAHPSAFNRSHIRLCAHKPFIRAPTFSALCRRNSAKLPERKCEKGRRARARCAYELYIASNTKCHPAFFFLAPTIPACIFRNLTRMLSLMMKNAANYDTKRDILYPYFAMHPFIYEIIKVGSHTFDVGGCGDCAPCSCILRRMWNVNRRHGRPGALVRTRTVSSFSFRSAPVHGAVYTRPET